MTIEAYALLSAISYFSVFIFCMWKNWDKHKHLFKPIDIKKSDEMDSILATAKYYKELDAKKGYVNAFEYVRKNPNRVPPKPNAEKFEAMKRKALREVKYG